MSTIRWLGREHMRIILNSTLFVWLLLALPGIVIMRAYASGRLDAMDMLHPTGEFAVRFMVLAMAIGPLAALLGHKRWIQWLMVRRRWIGFAAFLYAIAHLVFYVVDMGTIDDILAEITEHGIWTGWAAMVLIAVPGLTSTDRAMRLLRRGWKRAQQFAYPAAFLTAFHWALLEMEWGGAIVHFGPLVLLNALRGFKNLNIQKKGLPA